MQQGRIELHFSLLPQDAANLGYLLTPFKICDIRRGFNREELKIIPTKLS